MSIAQEFSRVSIRDPTISRNTDQLYDPLRATLTHPQKIQQHSSFTPLATRSSFVTKDYRILTPQELQRLEQNIYIPNTTLYPTNNLQQVRNQRFVAVDATERILGPPITPEELERIKMQGFRKQEVVYETKKPEELQYKSSVYLSSRSSANVVQNTQKTQKLNAPPPLQSIQEQTVIEYEPAAERYTAQTFQDYGKSDKEYKYNLFSMIDEPVNKCRQFGLGGCTSCPSNEVIASRNKPLGLIWK